MKKSYLVQFSLIVLFLCIGVNGYGQILAWQFNSAPGEGKDVTYNSTTTDANLVTSVLTRGAGAPASSSVTNTFATIFTTSTTLNEAISNNAYFEFTVKPKAGYYVSLTDLDVNLRIAVATMYYQFRYSLDGTNFTDIGSPGTLSDLNDNGVFQSTIDLAAYTDLTNVSSATTITFRLYGWGASGSFAIGKSGSANVNALFFGGIVSNTLATVSANPKIAGWELSALSGTTSTSVNATSNNTNITTPILSRGAGLTAGSLNFTYASKTALMGATKTASKTNNEYYQLTIPPKSGYKVSLSTLKYRFRATSTAVTRHRWAYSIDGGTTFYDVGSADVTNTVINEGADYQLDLSGTAALQNVASTVYLRMYVWGATANTAVFGLGRILATSSTGAPINSVYVRGIVDELPVLNQMPVTIETTSNYQKKTMNENVVYFTNRVYTAYNVPANLANYEFLSSDGGVSADGVTPTGTIIPSQNGDIYVLARTSTGVPGWELVPGTEFFYLAGSTSAGISVFKKTVTAGERIPIPVVDNFQEAKPFAKTINYNLYRSVGSGNWSDNTKWELSTDNVNWNAAVAAPTSAASSVSIPAGHELIVDVPATASIVTVNPTAKLTVNNATTFNATTLNLNNDANGAATFIDNGTSGITTANVQQYLTSGRNWYVSIPVSTAAGSALWSATSVVCWDETIGDWVSPALSTLNPMRGYISVNTTTSGNIMFSGQLNNGEKYIDLTYSAGKTKAGYNLVGNPYPSYLNWTADIANAANALTTIWYRTKVDGVYDFHTYNADGNVGSPVEITGQIPPMQAFWVKVKAGGGRLTFNNSMRSHGSVSVPLKAPGATSSSAAEQKLIRIKVTNHTNSDETVVYFNAKASDNFDSFDSPKMSNNNNVIPEIFTFADKEELVINGLNNSNTERVIPLGFRTGEANNFSISLSELKNFDENTQVLLKDNQENTEADITAGNSYDFSSEVANTTDRFSIILRNREVTTGNRTVVGNNLKIRVLSDKSVLVNIQGITNEQAEVSVYNTSGQLIEQSGLKDDTALLTKCNRAGVYFVKLLVDDKYVSTAKIVIR